MVRQSYRVKVERNRASNYFKIALSFEEASRIAYEFDYYNAAGVLIVHAAIALADPITIKTGATKCKGENHYEVINLIREKVNDDSARNNAIKHLEALISHKSLVSYTGDIYKRTDIDKLFKKYDRFSLWAKQLLQD